MDSLDYRRIEKAIGFLEEHTAEQPSLDEVAEHIGLSSYHFQRLFRRWAGVSPKRFLQYLTTEHAKKLLREPSSVLDTTYSVGLSSPGRLHDLFVSVEAVTPGEFKERGKGVEIRYGFHPTPLGDCLLALTDRGVCSLWFLEEDHRDQAVAELRETWQRARLHDDPAASRSVAARIFARSTPSAGSPIPLFLSGTNFQIKVWKALLRIPEGAVVSYGGLATWLGFPNAARAVANAVGRNPIAYLIPCHRVLRSSGDVGKYRWGTTRKKAILGRELAA
jgi:AraC family transcriptional regulator of adaptative response/methylated-DNA-[protein]-cysteine methyltransferase